MGKLDPKNPQPPYLQIAEDLMSSIRNGALSPGDSLPSYNTLATQYGVAVGTVRSALDVLRDRSVIVTRHGTGSFVHPDLDIATLPPSIDRPVAVQAADLAEVLRLLHDISERLAVLESRLGTD
ncbi:GntR family transcriptional regulator [Saccharopolyspora spinosa]|uniref:Regulatory GntR family protein n=1 Tax=Saccharopolyspora spinosa TaxID=60894 RepID=A0A2N3XTD8_SACSN|nr:GntR family transcriptional regulator [Saccharopolyspora spinosa]PKW13909.1 regulatory GntR family protein [Saccharopolyspora spinosa]